MIANAVRRTHKDLVAQLQLNFIANKNVDVPFTAKVLELNFDIPP